ncbi:uncharacterized protein LOC131329692 [Rhododendron vialii]|uniref:uncharacterized protein LOC131329692 n=1 Tax=Rhododendron vialii TaxID=182163 RepID=UPI00265EBBE9|nr:uncharacterized protein LOC131329692 [Rhododendron vialii]
MNKGSGEEAREIVVAIWCNSKHQLFSPPHSRRPLSFEMGDHVFLKVSPRRDLSRFGKKGKLSLRYIGLFDIIEKIGEVAYRLAMPPRLSNVHDVFHVSMLRKYEPDPSHVLEWSELELEADASYEEEPKHRRTYVNLGLGAKDIIFWKLLEVEV